ncbi:MAG: histidinol dehydrogenase, partial [Rhodospirillales bacterium]
MATYLKKGVPQEKADAVDQQVRRTVEKIIADVRARGDEAVRELSQQFDSWNPETFLLPRDKIDEIV